MSRSPVVYRLIIKYRVVLTRHTNGQLKKNTTIGHHGFFKRRQKLLLEKQVN